MQETESENDSLGDSAFATPESVNRLLWGLRPTRIPGKIGKYLAGKGGMPPTAEVSLLIPLTYPNGQECHSVLWYQPKSVSGEFAMITLKAAPLEQRTSKQPDLVVVDAAEQALKTEVQQAQKLYDAERFRWGVDVILTREKTINERLAQLEEREQGLVRLSHEEAIKIATPVLKEADRERQAEKRAAEDKQREIEAEQTQFRLQQASIRADLMAELEHVPQKVDALLTQRWAEAEAELETRHQKISGKEAEFARVGGDHLLKLLAKTNMPPSSTDELVREEYADAPPALIKSLQSYFTARDYSVDQDVLTQTLLSLCVAAATGQFVLLTGPPGSGKTSLVTGLAHALGAGRGVVPVRPAWIDTSDLIGFYDPRLERYQPTPFLDRLADAGTYAEANRLFFLALDEMNLGRVENYAADFLSQLEKVREGEKDAGIELYSDDIAGRLVAERNRLLASVHPDEADPDLAARIALLLTHLGRYPARLSIPEGLVFFGTINVDETTNLPSPKFLDRSFVVQIADTPLPAALPKPRKGGKREGDGLGWSLTQSLIDQILAPETELPSGATKAWRDLLSWQEPYLRPLGIRLSHRLSQVYRAYMAAATILKVTPTTTVAETFVLAKVLPLISFRDDEPEDGGGARLKMDVLRLWRDDGLAGYPLVHNALDRILSRGGLIVRYFE